MKHKGLTLLELLIVVSIIGILSLTFATPAFAERKFSASPPLATATLGTDGAGNVARGVVIPADPNAQTVIYAIDATGNTAGDVIEIYSALSIITAFPINTTLAFSGGNTNYIHAPNSIQGDGSTTSGNSYFVLQDPGGKVAGWGEFLDKAGAGTGDIIQIHSNASSFATGNGSAGGVDLSGVTFPERSKVYQMRKIGEHVITTANANTARENDQGLFVGEIGAPILVINTDSTTGVTIHYVTGGLEMR